MPEDKKIEYTTNFTPKFNSDGLITVIAQDASSSEVLMVGYMNRQALDATIRTGYATYYSRSRKKLWKKGEQSGHFQKVEKILVDCDQDTLILRVNVDAGQCHAGYQSCFYRKVKKDNPAQLEFTAEKVFDPDKTYKK
jgi:phosphoribosyl-AMP cyclohydrolase